MAYCNYTPHAHLRPLTLCLVVVSILVQGCIKYTPSREELERERSDKPNLSAPLGSEEEFNAYERTLTNRLHKLLSERSYLLSVSQAGSGYVLGPGDIVEVDVYGFGDLRSEVEVSPQGTLSLPLIGEADVRGKDILTAKRYLAGRYAHYVKNPRVDVAVKNYHSNRISVIGEVQRPGMYPLRRNGQLLTELLSEAGGKNQLASNRIILLPAANLGTYSPPQISPDPTLAAQETGIGVEIEMEALLGKLDQRPLLVPLVAGDTVVVPEAGNFEVDGEVQKPGSFKLASSTSVISAIAAAGGLTYSADVKKVEVIRDIGGGRKALATLDLEEVGLRGGKDIRLRAGDLVRVPSEPGRFFGRQVVETLNTLFNGVSVSQRAN